LRNEFRSLREALPLDGPSMGEGWERVNPPQEAG
jgi:hypothetical protein